MMTEQKNNILTDVFSEWASTGEFFDILTDSFDVPWKSYVDGDVLDLDYFGNRSGRKLVSDLVRSLVTDTGLSTANKTKLATLAWKKYGKNWKKAWDAFTASYDPLKDFGITDTVYGVDHVAEDGTNGNTNTQNTNNKAYGFNSVNGKNASANSTTQENHAQYEYERNGSFNNTRTKGGLVGTNTVQNLIRQELDLVFDYDRYFDLVFRDVDKILAVNIFGRSQDEYYHDN